LDSNESSGIIKILFNTLEINMKNFLKYLCLQILLISQTIAQNVNIGNTKPTIARFEVSGVAGTGKTSALFTPTNITGTPTAISLQRDNPIIGFNHYQDDNSAVGKYIGTGYASTFGLNINTGAIEFKQFFQGVMNTPTFNNNDVLRILSRGNVIIGNTPLTSDQNNVSLSVERNTENTLGTVVFSGSQNSSHFHYSNNEDTYIRAGLNSSKVVINNFGNPDGISPNIGRIQIIGKTSVGLGGSTEPDLSLQIHGAMAGSKHVYIDAGIDTPFNGHLVNNASIITLTNNANKVNPTIYISPEGCTDGQILILHNSLNIDLTSGLKKNESVLYMYKAGSGWGKL
jgi:hypothetical protein